MKSYGIVLNGPGIVNMPSVDIYRNTSLRTNQTAVHISNIDFAMAATTEGSLAYGDVVTHNVGGEVLLTIQSSPATLSTAGPEATDPVSIGSDIVTPAPSSGRVEVPSPSTIVDSSLPRITIETVHRATADVISTADGSEVTSPGYPISLWIPSASKGSDVTTPATSGTPGQAASESSATALN